MSKTFHIFYKIGNDGPRIMLHHEPTIEDAWEAMEKLSRENPGKLYGYIVKTTKKA